MESGSEKILAEILKEVKTMREDIKLMNGTISEEYKIGGNRDSFRVATDNANKRHLKKFEEIITRLESIRIGINTSKDIADYERPTD